MSSEECLNPNRRLLFEALLAKDQMLAPMYLGAVVLFVEKETPDWQAMAAHNLRELMEKVPRVLDVPMEPERPSLKQRCRDLFQDWERAKASECNGQEGWKGELDGLLRQFFMELEQFFVLLKTDYPTRAEAARQAIRALDRTSHALPGIKMRRLAKQWRSTQDIFTNVAHHRYRMSEEELLLLIEELEQMLEDRLIPKTITEYRAIDKIIEEGEGVAD